MQDFKNEERETWSGLLHFLLRQTWRLAFLKESRFIYVNNRWILTYGKDLSSFNGILIWWKYYITSMSGIKKFLSHRKRILYTFIKDWQTALYDIRHFYFVNSICLILYDVKICILTKTHSYRNSTWIFDVFLAIYIEIWVEIAQYNLNSVFLFQILISIVKVFSF